MKHSSENPLAGAQPQQAPVHVYHYGRGNAVAGLIYLGLAALGLYLSVRAVLSLHASLCGSAIMLAFAIGWFAFLRLRPWPTRHIRCDEDGIEVYRWLLMERLSWRDIIALRLKSGNNVQIFVLESDERTCRLGIDDPYGAYSLDDWRTFVQTVVERAALEFVPDVPDMQSQPGVLTSFIASFGEYGIDACHRRQVAGDRH